MFMVHLSVISSLVQFCGGLLQRFAMQQPPWLVSFDRDGLTASVAAPAVCATVAPFVIPKHGFKDLLLRSTKRYSVYLALFLWFIVDWPKLLRRDVHTPTCKLVTLVWSNVFAGATPSPWNKYASNGNFTSQDATSLVICVLGTCLHVERYYSTYKYCSTTTVHFLCLLELASKYY